MAEVELRSALIVAIPEAASTVDDWHERDPAAHTLDEPVVDPLGERKGRGSSKTLSEAEADVVPGLPMSAEACEVLLLDEVEPHSARGRTRARLPFSQRA